MRKPPGNKYLIENGKLVRGKCARGLEQFDMIREIELIQKELNKLVCARSKANLS